LANVSSVASYPPGYGLGCGQHDAASPQVRPECASSTAAPASCNATWCYVRVEQCSLSAPVTWSTDGLVRSYETCGSLDPYSLYQLIDDLNGISLRVVWLTDSAGWKGSYCSEDGPCSGLIPAFVEHLSTRLDLQLEVVTLPYPDFVLRQLDSSYGPTGTSFDACAIASGLGYVDLCIGSFESSSQRQQETTLVNLYPEPIYLMTVENVDDTEDSFLDNLEAAFRPFPWEFWLIFVAAMILLSLLTLMHEYLAGAVGPDVHPMTALLLSLWDAARSILGRGGQIQVTSPAGQLSTCARGFLARMTLCTYIAALMAQMITSSRMEVQGQVSSIDDVVSGGHSVCLEGSMRSSIQMLYPNLTQIVEVNRPELLTSVTDGRCSFALAALQDLEEHQGRGEHCEVTRLGDPVMNMQMALAASPRFGQALRYQVAAMSATWQSLLAETTPARACGAVEEQGSEIDDVFGGRRLTEPTVLQTVRRLLAESADGPVSALFRRVAGLSGGTLEMKYMVGPLALALMCIVVGMAMTIAGFLCSAVAPSRYSDKASLSSMGSEVSSEVAGARLSSGANSSAASTSKVSLRPSTQKAEGAGFDCMLMLSVLQNYQQDLKTQVEEMSVAINNARWTRSSKAKVKGPSTKVLMQDVLKEVSHANTRVKGSRQSSDSRGLNYSLGMLIG